MIVSFFILHDVRLFVVAVDLQPRLPLHALYKRDNSQTLISNDRNASTYLSLQVSRNNVKSLDNKFATSLTIDEPTSFPSVS